MHGGSTIEMNDSAWEALGLLHYLRGSLSRIGYG